MAPKEYEQYIASIFQNQGYKTLVTPYSNDWGIDVIAIKGKEKIAIQAKMCGNKKKSQQSCHYATIWSYGLSRLYKSGNCHRWRTS